MKEYNSLESLQLDANEIMLASRGFVLFAVTESGDIKRVCYVKELNSAEKIGLQTMIHSDVLAEIRIE